jgi:hypothetical protein
MMITRKAIPRRTLLRGIGATVALPLLDSMVPALTAFQKTAAKPVRRFGVVYAPNGMEMGRWTPLGEDADLQLSPILTPLAAFRDHMVVLTGLDLNPALPAPGEGNGDHARAGGAFLTATHPRKTEGADLRAGISIDQIAAQHIGQDTPLTSLELAIDTNELLGACDPGYSCAYVNTICWRNENTPLPMENNPRALFERLFGSANADPAARAARIRQDRSILDSVMAESRGLQGKLGAGDRGKMNQFLDAVRDVEQRIQRVEAHGAQDLPAIPLPAGIPEAYEDHVKLMFDLQVLAYQADLSRVITFMLAREVSARAYPQVGVSDPHHPLSHHQSDPEKLARLAKINAYHMSLFAYYLDRLHSTNDGDGSLLDHSAILYGAGISESNAHLHTNLPLLVAGGAAGQIKGGRHLRSRPGTPVANLYLTLLDRLGARVEKIGDSTGQIEHFAEV